jgi:uncharacterized SAM-binding protein YcdF (DUF218 family)
LFINSIVKLLFSPEIFITSGFLAAWIFRKNRKIKITLLSITLLLLFIVFISPVPIYLVQSWERNYNSLLDVKNVIANNKTSHIVILGAGHTNDPELSVTSQLSNDVALRMLEGVRIYKQLDSAKFIASGSPNKNNPRSQAEVVADASVLLGVSPNDTFYLDMTENTEDEARDYSARFGYLKDSVNVILVTSAIHMPRAVFLFNKYGVNVISAPCNYLVKFDPEDKGFGWKPSLKKIYILDRFMDEWLGVMWAKIK